MKRRSFVICGLGSFGATIGADLVRTGHHVLGICNDMYNINRMADVLNEVVNLDMRDDDALREAGAGTHQVGIVAINDLELSILCTMNLKLLGVETIWVQAISKAHHRIATRLDVDRVLLPEQEMGRHAAQMLSFPAMRDYVSLGNGHHVVDMTTPACLAGSPLSDESLLAKHDIKPLGLMRGTELVTTQKWDEVILEEGDKLLLLGRSQDLRDFGHAISSEN